MYWLIFIVWLFFGLLIWAFIAGASIASGNQDDEDYNDQSSHD